MDGLFRILWWFDTYIVDGAVNGVAWLTMSTGGALRRFQTGQLQTYGLAIFFGVLVIAACLLIFGL